MNTPYECHHKLKANPEMGDANLKCALWTFQQQLSLKMKEPCGFPLFSCKRFCTVHFWICGHRIKVFIHGQPCYYSCDGFFTNLHYCHLLIPIHLLLQHLMLVNLKSDISKCNRITFQCCGLHWTRSVLMAPLKQSWQYWHSCVMDSF